MSNQAIIIGMDHGYAAVKTPHCTLPTGLTAVNCEPFPIRDVLEFDGRYYIIGNNYQSPQWDKTATDHFYFLTLAAVVRELRFRQASRIATVSLAVGLPLTGDTETSLTGFERDRQTFRQYLLRDGRPVTFRFEGVNYRITIDGVSLFPQGCAATLLQGGLSDARSVIVADIGGHTVNFLRIKDRVPDPASCHCLKTGTVQCCRDIAEQVHQTLGVSLTGTQVESVLRGSPGGVNATVADMIRQEAASFVNRILSDMEERGMETRTTPVIFMGGGAALLKQHIPHGNGLVRPVILGDAALNAKTYDLLAKRKRETGSYGVRKSAACPGAQMVVPHRHATV